MTALHIHFCQRLTSEILLGFFSPSNFTLTACVGRNGSQNPSG